MYETLRILVLGVMKREEFFWSLSPWHLRFHEIFERNLRKITARLNAIIRFPHREGLRQD